MAIKFTQTYIDTIARSHLPAGEQVVAATAGVYKPLFGMAPPFFWKKFLVVGSRTRLLLVEHRRGILFDRLEKIESYAWSELSTLKVSGLLLKKKLKMMFSTGREALTIELPGFLFSPIARAIDGAKQLVGSWDQGKLLPSTPAPAPHGYQQQQQQAPSVYSA